MPVEVELNITCKALSLRVAQSLRDIVSGHGGVVARHFDV